MEPILMPAEDFGHDTDEGLLVHAWRSEQLGRLGLPRVLAEAFADRVDWHALAELIERARLLAGARARDRPLRTR
jgi:hypothetical protein